MNLEKPVKELKLGRYRIVREIGRGTGGNVFEALDLRLDRVVAIKILRSDATAPAEKERIERFLREARAAARLSHPGIVAVYDSDVDPDTGHPFIVMEFVNGRSLHEVLAVQPKLELSLVVSIGIQVARALQAAHDQGIIHRDVKPANLLLTGDGRVKLTDFGIARLDASDLTSRGDFVGTPNYASPEQVEGGPVDGRSDLFCLGVVLFRCATGVLPFAGDSLTAVSLRIARGEFESARKLAPELPAAFHDFLRKALARVPGARFSSGEEMARALEGAAGLAGNETLELPVATEAPSLTAVSRRRAAAPSAAGSSPFPSSGIAGAVALAVLLAAGGFLYWMSRPSGATASAPSPAAAPPPAPTPVPVASPEEGPSSAVPGLRIIESPQGRLVVEHRSHLAEETLIAAVDGREVLRKDVRLTGGVFRRIGGKTFRWTVPVPAGTHSIRVRVIGRSMKTDAASSIQGVVPPDGSATLAVVENPYRDTLTLSWK